MNLLWVEIRRKRAALCRLAGSSNPSGLIKNYGVFHGLVVGMLAMLAAFYLTI
jgi:hypothetical protein